MDVYKIGIAIMMTGNLSSSLSIVSHQLLGVHKSVNQINAGFGKWKTALIGAAGIMAGTGILRGFVKIAEHGKELLDQQDKLIRAGRTYAEVTQLTADAYAIITKLVPTATGANVLRVANELTLVKGDFKDAIAATAGALKLEAILGNATGRKSEGEGYNVWRALELKNVTMNRELTDKLMGGIVQAMIVSGGKITGLDWLTAARQGGVAWTNADPAFVTGTLPTVIQELGGQRTGTSMMTAYQTLLGATTLRNQQIEMFQRLGLMDMGKATKDHGHWNIAPGAIKGSGMGMTDPFRWTQEVLKPAFEKIGMTGINEQREWMAKIFPNRNANRMFDIFLDPASVARIGKDRALYGQGLGLDSAYVNYIGNNPKGVEAAFNAQYKSMVEAIGAPFMQAAMPVMVAVTGMFNGIGAFAQQHASAVGLIGDGIVGIGVALVSTSGLAILAAIGPAGWLIGGIAGLGTALAAYPDFIKHLSSDWAKTKGMSLGDVFQYKGSIWEDVFGHGRSVPSGIVPPSAAKDRQTFIGNFNVDGRKLASIVFENGARSASGPDQSASSFDGTMGHTPVSFGFARA